MQEEQLPVLRPLVLLPCLLAVRILLTPRVLSKTVWPDVGATQHGDARAQVLPS